MFKRFMLLCFSIVILSSVQYSPVSADSIDIERTEKKDVIPNQYVVVFKESAFVEGQTLNGETIENLSQSLVEQADGELLHTYTSALQGFAAVISAENLKVIENDPTVDYIVPDQMAYLDATQLNPPSWGLDRTDQRDLPLNNQYNYDLTGANVHVYIVDTGIRPTHNDFGGRVSGGATFIFDGNGTNDCNGHGSHVAGTVGGSSYGIAKGVSLHPVRVFGCSGGSPYSTIISGVDWITNNFVAPAVANMSLGGGGFAPLDTAVNNSIAAGVVYVVSAGNSDADACGFSPARVNNAITVGATTIDDRRARATDWGWPAGSAVGSNFGTCVDIFAPGTDITSAWFNSNTASNTINGTSMASPHVAGVAALYLEQNPSATPATVMSDILANGSVNKLSDIGTGSPNLLLYSDFFGSSGQTATLYFDWNCDGSYSSTTMTFNNDGTAQIGSSQISWTNLEGMLLWQFDTGNQTTYAGNSGGKATEGVMSTFSGLQGCWYLLTDDDAGLSSALVTEDETIGINGEGSEGVVPSQPGIESVVGSWTLYFDWNCDGSYSSTTMTFNSGGTMNFSAKWYESEGMVHFKFNSSRTSYGGNVAGDAMVGTMSTFSGLEGCWYALPTGALALEVLDHTESYDEMGQPVGKSDKSEQSKENPAILAIKTATLYFDWNCDGSYSSTSISFNDSNNTFQIGSSSGNWSSVEGVFLFQFGSSSTTYVGNSAGKTTVGVMSTFSGLQGCWYMLADDNTGITAPMVNDEPADVLGTGAESFAPSQPGIESVVGSWTLYFDWGCDGSYYSTSITFNSNGTTSVGATWYESEGMIHWKYNSFTTSYGGNVAGDAMVGSMSTFSGLEGCWYALPSGALASEAPVEQDGLLQDGLLNEMGQEVNGRSTLIIQQAQ